MARRHRTIVAAILMVGCTALCVGAQEPSRCNPEAPGPCEVSVEGVEWVGLCLSRSCAPKVPVAALETELWWGRNMFWVRQGLSLLGCVSIGFAAAWVWRFVRRRRAGREARLSDGRARRESRSSRLVPWIILPVLCGASFIVIRHRAISYDWARRAHYRPRPAYPPDHPSFVVSASPGLASDDKRSILVVSLHMPEERTGMIVGYDLATCKPVWSRAENDWLDHGVLFAMHGEKVIVVDGHGRIETRDAFSGAVLATDRYEYRVRQLGSVKGKKVIQIRGWGDSSLYAVDTDTGKVSMRWDLVHNFHPVDPGEQCSAEDAIEWKTFSPTFHPCVYPDVATGLTDDGEMKRELVTVDLPSKTIRWRQPIRRQTIGSLWRTGGLLLVKEKEDSNYALVARNLDTGTVRWEIPKEYDGVVGDDRFVALSRVFGASSKHSSIDVRRASDGSLVCTLR